MVHYYLRCGVVMLFYWWFLRFGEHFCFPPIIVGKFEGVREILLDFVGLLGGKKMVWLGIFHLG